MKKNAFLGFVGVALSCSVMAVDVSTQIVNGEDVSTAEFNDEYSSFISLFYDRIEYDGTYSPEPFCGGSILDSTHILTAAHCYHTSDGSLDTDYMLFTSVARAQNKSDFPDSVDQRVMVKRYYVHEDYVHSSLELWPNDIVILELESELNIDSVNDVVTPLSSESYRSTANSFFAVGHGNLESNVESGDELQHVDVTFENNTVCSETFGNQITDNQLCFDGEDMGELKKATCQGDSGGPIYWSDSGVMKQVGIVSFGPTTCGDDTADVILATTELSDYAVWITSVLNGEKDETYTATDTKRNDAVSVSNLSSSDSGGGGSVPLWSLATLFTLGLLRRKN